MFEIINDLKGIRLNFNINYENIFILEYHL